jgi:hypothetical protein
MKKTVLVKNSIFSFSAVFAVVVALITVRIARCADGFLISVAPSPLQAFETRFYISLTCVGY